MFRVAIPIFKANLPWLFVLQKMQIAFALKVSVRKRLALGFSCRDLVVFSSVQQNLYLLYK